MQEGQKSFLWLFADGDALSVTGVSDPPNGMATINGDGTIAYTPDENYNGSDSFTYTVSDGSFTDEGMVSITVTPMNDAPGASTITEPADESAITISDPGLDLTVGWGEGVDVDGDPVSYEWESALREEDFDEPFFSVVTEDTSFVVNYGALADSLYAAGVVFGETVTLFHRVIVTDGELTTAGPTATLDITLDIDPTDAEEGGSVPNAFALVGAYPNPTTRAVQIAFDLAEPSEVVLELYDVLGRRVRRHDQGVLAAGAGREVRVDAARLGAGVYLYRVVAVGAHATNHATGRLTVVR